MNQAGFGENARRCGPRMETGIIGSLRSECRELLSSEASGRNGDAQYRRPYGFGGTVINSRLIKTFSSEIFTGEDGADLRPNEELSRHTTMRVGGPVTCLVRPWTHKGLAAFFKFAGGEGVPCFVLGNGSNVLAPGEPWDVLVVRLDLCGAGFSVEETSTGRFQAVFGAGARLSRCLNFCLSKGLGGMEWAAGIPGTIGGALATNAGTAAGSTADRLLWAECLDGDGNLHRLRRDEMDFAYRRGGLPRGWLALSACFELQGGADMNETRRIIREAMRRRMATQPLGVPSAGSVFKNPPGHFAGALIEQAGLKGFRMGRAKVSEKHANWIINEGGATSGEIRALIELIEEKVQKRFAIRLEKEIQLLGPGTTGRVH